MFQRPDSRRQQMGATNVNSAYFTSAGAAPSPSQPLQPMHGYGYAPQSSSHQSYYGGGDTSSYAEISTSSNIPKYAPKRSGSGSFGVVFLLVWTTIVVGVSFVFFNTMYLSRQLKQQEESIMEEQERTTNLWKDKLHDLHQKYQELEQKHGDSSNSNASSRKLQASLSQERKWALEWKEKAESLENNLKDIQGNIQESSRQKLLLKYGPGPYNVEVEVSFRGKDDRSDMGYMTLELAGADEMPHATFHFLEQMDQGMYNFGEFGFNYNAPHFTIAAPVTRGLLDRFGESGISQLLFAEYSPMYNHDAYSIGFTGRPGGPNFYINTRDNSELHGPGGYAKDGSADPCFGRITRGHDVVDRINSANGELRDGDWKEIQEPILILSINRLD